MEIEQIEELYKTISIIQKTKHDKYQENLTPFVLSRFISLVAIDDLIFDTNILELGIGYGNLSIGLSLIGAGYILGVDFDENMLNVCNENIDIYRRLYGDNGTNIDLLHMNVYNETFFEDFEEFFDVIVMNPPSGKDEIKFINAALQLNPSIVYCILSPDVREECQELSKQFDIFCDVIATINIDHDQPIDFVKFYYPKTDQEQDFANIHTALSESENSQISDEDSSQESECSTENSEDESSSKDSKSKKYFDRK